MVSLCWQAMYYSTYPALNTFAISNDNYTGGKRAKRLLVAVPPRSQE